MQMVSCSLEYLFTQKAKLLKECKNSWKIKEEVLKYVANWIREKKERKTKKTKKTGEEGVSEMKRSEIP